MDLAGAAAVGDGLQRGDGGVGGVLETVEGGGGLAALGLGAVVASNSTPLSACRRTWAAALARRTRASSSTGRGDVQGGDGGVGGDVMGHGGPHAARPSGRSMRYRSPVGGRADPCTSPSSSRRRMAGRNSTYLRDAPVVVLVQRCEHFLCGLPPSSGRGP